jgi:hypothetical protein
MVRRYLPEREDGLVSWSVPGKRRAVRTTRLDVTRSEKGVDERNVGPEGDANVGHAPARSVRRTGRTGEKRGGTAPGTPVEQAATDVNTT